MDTPIRFNTNFKNRDGNDLGNKFITKDYLLTVYPYLLPRFQYNFLYWTGARETSLNSFSRVNLLKLGSFSTRFWKQISNSVLFGRQGSSSNAIFHSAIISEDGYVWTWGDNASGQLGHGDFTNRYGSPVRITSAGNDWNYVSCGSNYTLAIKNDGSLWGWGENSGYELGIDTITDQKSPVQIGTDYDWKFICASHKASFGIKKNGTLWSWGTNYEYLLGSGSSSSTSVRTTPQIIGTDSDWKMVSCQGQAAYAIKTDGTLWMWGNGDGRILGTSLVSINSPILFDSTNFSTTKWKYVSVGVRHVVIISEQGEMYSRGYNELGALGNNTYTSTSVFQQIYNRGLWKYVSSGYDFNVGIMVDGSLWAWGNNLDRQVSTSTSDSFSRPVLQSSTYEWKQVSCHPFAYGAIGINDTGVL